MLKIIEDLCSAIAGNAKTRINDPFIGTFICSWIVCNWNNLALLFWGEGKAEERISAFYIYLSQTPFWEFNRLFFVPLLIALFYLFVFPWVSLLIKFFQHWANEKLHQQAVGRELTQITQKEELNKAKLRADPSKKFLSQIVQQEIDKKEEILEHVRQRSERLKARVQEAKEALKEQEAKRKEQEAQTKSSQLDLEKKEKQAELDKIRFETDSAKARATLASHRFPSAYLLMSKIEASLKEDGFVVSLNTTGKIVAALFGYDNFESLLDDKKFNNETLDQVKYVYYDDELAKRLEQIVLDEDSENEDFSADMIFGHFEMLFEGEPFELVTGERLAEYAKEEIENDPHDILNCDGTSGAIAESDTIFEYVEDISIEHFDFGNGFYTELSVSASGEHRREKGVPGRSMTVSIKMECPLLVGKYGLGAIEQGNISGSLDEFD
jgi:hypothetical protein